MSSEAAIIEVRQGYERNFGLVFAAIFVIVGLFPLLMGGPIRWWAMAVATIFMLITLYRTQWLVKPNHYWFKFGMLLGAIVAPVVMALVFIVTVVPVGFVMRALRKDLLSLRIDRQATSYWLPRKTPIHPMKNQF